MSSRSADSRPFADATDVPAGPAEGATTGRFVDAPLTSADVTAWVPRVGIPSTLEEAWLEVLLILVGSVLLARSVQWASHRYLDDELAETTFGRSAIAEIHTPLAVSIGLLGVYLSLTVLELQATTPEAGRLIATALVVLWARASIRIGRRWIELLQEAEQSYEFAPMFGNLWTITVVVGAVLLLLSVWQVQLTPFLASAGILGIVVGFAAQDAIGNLIGGVALYFDNTYKVGDVIRVEGDMRGTVTDVGIRSTTVLTQDNLVVTVPNAVLNSTQVVNESAPQRHMRLRVPISAAYGSDLEEIEEIVLGVCKGCSIVRDSPQPRLLFLEFGDSALLFELHVYINHPLAEKRAVDRVNRLVYEAFDEADITIPFPQREISFHDDADTARGREGGGRVHRFDERLDVTEADGTADGNADGAADDRANGDPDGDEGGSDADGSAEAADADGEE